MSIFNDQRHIRRKATREAAGWLARHEAGTIDEARFEAWRAAHPGNAIAFARALSVWRAAETPSSSLPQAQPLAAAGLSRRRALGAFGGMGLVGLLAAGGVATRAYAWDSARSGIGECRRLILPDGSRAMLNTDSLLQWRFSDTERSLWIARGEVALELLPGIPARVHGQGLTAALSTGRFNVRLQTGAMDVTVLTGRAAASTSTSAPSSAIGSPRPAEVAAPNEGLLLSAADPSVRPASPQHMAATVAWQQGEIVFDNEPLQTAVQEYNRYLPGKIVIADPDLTGIPVGGRFTSTDPAAFLSALELGLDIRATPHEGGFILTR
ncbi:FecR family protein [Novosphingobium sp.]|jgi:transmembrane sensor|uniref:FecR family protein n=1 Tax=Novosphingobium sp. TaxID=1874826 RepID=UPI003D6D705D